MRTDWISFLLVFAMIFSLSNVSAQEEAPSGREIAAEQVKALKDGTLVVRLTSNYKKVQALQKLANSNGIEESKRERIRDQLATTLSETAYENKLTFQAFKQFYSFSNVLFMYDTATITLTKEQIKENLFLDENLVIDSSQKLDTDAFFILKFDSTDPSTTSAAEAMIITDQNFDELRRPFPYAIKMTSFSFVMDSVFSPKQAFEKNINSRVKKLNKQLHAFYKKAIEE